MMHDIMKYSNLVYFQVDTEEEAIKSIFDLRQCLYNQELNDEIILRALAQKYYHNGVLLKAQYDSECVGLCAFYCNDFSSNKAFLSMLLVNPCHRGKGIGTKLLNDMEVFCKSKGMAFVNLEVNRNNHNAISLYEKLGYSKFEEKGTSLYYYKSI